MEGIRKYKPARECLLWWVFYELKFYNNLNQKAKQWINIKLKIRIVNEITIFIVFRFTIKIEFLYLQGLKKYVL